MALFFNPLYWAREEEKKALNRRNLMSADVAIFNFNWFCFFLCFCLFVCLFVSFLVECDKSYD